MFGDNRRAWSRTFRQIDRLITVKPDKDHKGTRGLHAEL